MTRKHFELLARALAWSRPPMDDTAACAQWQEDVNGMAVVAAGTNARFNKHKFIAACKSGPARR
jgi:hypothetical protein